MNNQNQEQPGKTLWNIADNYEAATKWKLRFSELPKEGAAYFRGLRRENICTIFYLRFRWGKLRFPLMELVGANSPGCPSAAGGAES